ncbi:CofH family radical SAM protein [Candidatus Chlamydia corallus]|uniref:CofH family radical SAM protein n=1 Tax=Candidatus Chlamydia corallus TaxID=2038470 RepID=UPI000C2F9220|nr:CofH family radical SAM protein [Candidatus Chlamydia corallus]
MTMYLPQCPKTSPVYPIMEKLACQERLNGEEALQLLLLDNKEDQQALWDFAHHVCKQRVGTTVYYSSTLYLYPTNFCDFSCKFCSFYAKPGDPKGWFHSPDDLLKQIQNTKTPITEVHIVGGCYPSCNLQYYVELFTKIKEQDPRIHIKALTAIEYAYLSDLHNISVKDVLATLKTAGLDSIPGGGAEILVDKIRDFLAPKRLSSSSFLKIHKTAHQLGIHSNITMLCYHREAPEDLVTHMIKVRDLQDETQSFKNFVILKFAQENNVLGKRLKKLGCRHAIPLKSLMAVARLFLDNFANMKALWNYLGVDAALDLLSCGANDLSSTHLGEKVFQIASSKEPVKMDIEGMAALIKQQGKTPCLTNSSHV